MEFNRFDHINHKPLRVFNRTAMANNILEDFGEGASENYLALFDDTDRRNIFILSGFIKKNGIKEARRICTEGMEFDYDVGSSA